MDITVGKQLPQERDTVSSNVGVGNLDRVEIHPCALDG